MSTAARSFKLSYFPIGGRAAPARLAFAIGGVKFTDERIDFGDDLFATVAAKREAEPKRFPNQTLPTLEITEADGSVKVLSQSIAISAYAARVGGIYPTSLEDVTVSDEISDQSMEIVNGLLGAVFCAPEEQEAKQVAFNAWTLPTGLARIESLTADGDFILGGAKPSWIDTVVFQFTSALAGGAMTHLPKDILASYPKLNRQYGAFTAYPAVADFLKAHPNC
jgi:glutathione S-transferase